MRLLLALILLAPLALTGCGKKGSPQPEGPADKITYPGVYPAR